MSAALTKRQAQPEEIDLFKLGATLAASGMFKDCKNEAQAVTKILAGRELGLSAIASLTHIHMVEGKPSLDAAAMGALIRKSKRYDYKILRHDESGCELQFFDGGLAVGTSSFTIADATKAGLAGKDNWRKYPKNMLFSRAMSNGVKWYCPDVMMGGLGADVDDDDPEGIGPAIEEADWEIAEQKAAAQLSAGQPMDQPADDDPLGLGGPSDNGVIDDDQVQELVDVTRAGGWLQSEVRTLLREWHGVTSERFEDVTADKYDMVMENLRDPAVRSEVGERVEAIRKQRQAAA